MASKVEITRFRAGMHIAECEHCTDLSPDATRAEARAHVADTGHTVRVVVEETTRYEATEGGGSDA